MMTFQSRVAALAPWHQTIDIGGGELTPGRWNPKTQATEIASWIPGGVAGKTVLDIGSNAGGIGLELSKLGASEVTLLEKNQKYHAQAEYCLERLKLPTVSAVRGSAYEVHEMPPADIKLWLGLVYHVRHPQLFIDYAASTGGEIHVFSTQISDDVGAVTNDCIGMFNRKPLYPSATSPLLGWEASSQAFQGMLKIAGYEIIGIHNRSGREWTNSLYVICRPPKKPTCDVVSAAKILDSEGNWF